jgi:cell division protein ZapB
MDDALKSLEKKVGTFVALCQRLREDNHQLRQQLVAVESENRQLVGRINAAKGRIESLLTQIPEEDA